MTLSGSEAVPLVSWLGHLPDYTGNRAYFETQGVAIDYANVIGIGPDDELTIDQAPTITINWNLTPTLPSAP